MIRFGRAFLENFLEDRRNRVSIKKRFFRNDERL